MHVLVYVALGLIALYVFLKRGPRRGKAIPGPTGWSILRYALKTKRKTVHDTCAELAEKYGDIFRLNAFGTSIVVLNNAETIRSFFCDDPYKTFTNDRVKTCYGRWVLFGGKNIFSTLNAHNSPHGELRKTFTRGMHVYGAGIKMFEAKVRSELVKLNERIERYDGKEFDMQELLWRSLSSIISILLSGQELEDSDPDLNMFCDFDRSLSALLRPDIVLSLMTFPFLRFVPGLYKEPFDTINRARDAIFKRYFHEAKRTYKPGTIRGLADFYIAEQRLAETEGRPVFFTDEGICASLIEIVAAGIPTTLATLTSVFLCLMNHPEYQAKIQEELDRVVGREELPTLSDRKDCVFVEAVNLEVQRYITVLPLSTPHLCKPNMEFEGYDVPANSVVVANTWFVHHDKKVWGDPWTFRPERWIDGNGELLPNNHILRKNWLAFGIGRRQCIGENFARSRTFLCVASLLQRWNFEMLPEHAMTCDPRMGPLEVDIICRPKPYLCRAVPRKRN